MAAVESKTEDMTAVNKQKQVNDVMKRLLFDDMDKDGSYFSYYFLEKIFGGSRKCRFCGAFGSGKVPHSEKLELYVTESSVVGKQEVECVRCGKVDIITSCDRPEDVPSDQRLRIQGTEVRYYCKKITHFEVLHDLIELLHIAAIGDFKKRKERHGEMANFMLQKAKRVCEEWCKAEYSELRYKKFLRLREETMIESDHKSLCPPDTSAEYREMYQMMAKSFVDNRDKVGSLLLLMKESLIDNPTRPSFMLWVSIAMRHTDHYNEFQQLYDRRNFMETETSIYAVLKERYLSLNIPMGIKKIPVVFILFELPRFFHYVDFISLRMGKKKPNKFLTKDDLLTMARIEEEIERSRPERILVTSTTSKTGAGKKISVQGVKSSTSDFEMSVKAADLKRGPGIESGKPRVVSSDQFYDTLLNDRAASSTIPPPMKEEKKERKDKMVRLKIDTSGGKPDIIGIMEKMRLIPTPESADTLAQMELHFNIPDTPPSRLDPKAIIDHIIPHLNNFQEAYKAKCASSSSSPPTSKSTSSKSTTKSSSSSSKKTSQSKSTPISKPVSKPAVEKNKSGSKPVAMETKSKPEPQPARMETQNKPETKSVETEKAESKGASNPSSTSQATFYYSSNEDSSEEEILGNKNFITARALARTMKERIDEKFAFFYPSKRIDAKSQEEFLMFLTHCDITKLDGPVPKISIEIPIQERHGDRFGDRHLEHRDIILPLEKKEKIIKEKVSKEKEMEEKKINEKEKEIKEKESKERENKPPVTLEQLSGFFGLPSDKLTDKQQQMLQRYIEVAMATFLEPSVFDKNDLGAITRMEAKEKMITIDLNMAQIITEAAEEEVREERAMVKRKKREAKEAKMAALVAKAQAVLEETSDKSAKDKITESSSSVSKDKSVKLKDWVPPEKQSAESKVESAADKKKKKRKKNKKKGRRPWEEDEEDDEEEKTHNPVTDKENLSTDLSSLSPVEESSSSMQLVGKEKGTHKAAAVVRENDAERRKTARDKFPNCENCGVAIKRIHVCSGCRKVAYCNSQCQRTHWKTHKKSCSYIASKKAGEEECTG